MMSDELLMQMAYWPSKIDFESAILRTLVKMGIPCCVVI